MHREEDTNQVHRYLSGELSPEEHKQFVQKMDSDPAHRNTVKEYQKVWNDTALYKVPEFDSTVAFARLNLEDEEASVRRLPVWARRAAVGAILIVAGWLAYAYIIHDQTWVIAGGHAIQEVELSDGSIVFVNTNSTLQYPKTFRKYKRVVRLAGEAFFDVSIEPERPFLIETDLAQVIVLGTSFGVEVDTESQSITVRVTEGTVRLQPSGSKLFLDIPAGEGASYSERTGELKSLKNPELNQLAWHTGTLTFVRTPVQQVVADLSETFDVTIDLRQSGIAACTYTSPQPFKNSSAEQVLEAMSIVFQMRVTSPEEGYYLVIGGSCE